MAKKEGYSREGFFGTIVHYDADGHKIGESRPGFFGGYSNYDAKGHKVGESRPGMFGEYVNYDNRGNRTGYVSPGFFGSQTHYDASGHKIGTTTPSLFGNQTHSGSFGGSTGIVNNAGAAAGIQRDEELLRTAAAAGAAAAPRKTIPVRAVSPSQSEPSPAARSKEPAHDPEMRIARYIIARLVPQQTQACYRITKTDAKVGGYGLDPKTGKYLEILAVVDCLEDELPPEAADADFAELF